MIQFHAKIRWKTEEEGGLTLEPFSGIQPSFAVGDELIMSQVFPTDGETEMRRGEEYEVLVKLPYGEKYRHLIFDGMLFNLNVGSRIIATGVMSKIE